jgi:hypothetical protein
MKIRDPYEIELKRQRRLLVASSMCFFAAGFVLATIIYLTTGAL